MKRFFLLLCVAHATTVCIQGELSSSISSKALPLFNVVIVPSGDSSLVRLTADSGSDSRDGVPVDPQNCRGKVGCVFAAAGFVALYSTYCYWYLSNRIDQINKGWG